MVVPSRSSAKPSRGKVRELRLSYTPPQLETFFHEGPQRFHVVPKGRRFGATQGAAHACIEWALEGNPILWGDTIHANIVKYVERYFLPPLKKWKIQHNWRYQEKQLTIGPGYIDFRSADRPENWEGFGYRKIVLNEAGIILKDRDLYAKSVLPMLIDYPDSELYALGVPKGKKLKDGTDHPFYALWKQTEASPETHRGLRFSSYDNPLLSPSDIQELEDEIAAMDPKAVPQEIYGEFTDRVAGTPWAFAFDEERHVLPTTIRPADRFIFVLDFNYEPFCAIVAQVWRDRQGDHCHIHKEIKISGGTIHAMAAEMAKVCRPAQMIVSGDRGGMAKRIGTTSNIPLFEELRRELNLTRRQIVVPPNPTHAKSREDTNYVLVHHNDFRVDPSCTGVIADLQSVEADADGGIVKSDRKKDVQRADLLDDVRYLISTHLQEWIKRNRERLQHDIIGGHAQPMRERWGPERISDSLGV